MSSCRRCAHEKFAHEHYRSGSDCSACDCARFSTSVLATLMARFTRHVALAPETPSKHATAA